MRNGGGLGDYLHDVPKTDPSYAARTIFDIIFFLLINITLLNIIFGIILDTFADLRSQTEAKRVEISRTSGGQAEAETMQI